jgi:hypothetical protein
MSDLLFQNISTVQSEQQQKPVTIASAAVIAPSTFLTFVTGTAAVSTISPPVTGAHMLALVFTTTTPAAFGTTGNIVTTTVAVTNRVRLLVYNPISRTYYQAG